MLSTFCKTRTVVSGLVSSLMFLAVSQLSVDAAEPGNPQLLDTVPKAGEKVTELTHVGVIFDRNVTGVDTADLLVNGIACTNSLFVSPREYIFYFPEPTNSGQVTFSWVANPGIADVEDPANLFKSVSWVADFDASAPPPLVVISEFMADNTTGVRDNEGNRSDWLELYNPGPDAVNLEGWFLSDESTNRTKWTLPAVSLKANGYLLIWASQRNLTNPALPLHANFRLAKDGGFLGLSDSKTNLISAFASYPAQRANISFGRDTVDSSLTGYYQTPTPGAVNSIGGANFAPDPVITVKGGAYPVQALKIEITAPYGQIRYSLDGSIPTNTTSLIYTNTITLTNNAVLSARVYQPGLLPGRIVFENYTFISQSVSNFSSNLPIIVIDSGGRTIPDSTRIRTFIATYEPKDGGRARIRTPDFETAARMEQRGQTSAGFPKVPWNLETDDIYGQDMDVPLLGLPSESEWALSNPYSDKCLMNNVLTFELSRKMGHYAARTVYCEVFVKNRNRPLTYPDDYRGVYVLMEKLRIDKNRVDITEMGSGTATEPDITGGYMVKKDKDSPGDANFSTAGGGGFASQALKYHQPAPRYITTAQKNWIRNYINTFERSMYATNWLTRTGTNHYSHYIDRDSLVDYHWTVEFTKQIDGYRLSNYITKDRGGKLRMEPIWDWNLAWGNADYLLGEFTNGWYYSQISDADHIWLRRMINGVTSAANTTRGDPEFNQMITDRWSNLKTNILNSTNIAKRINEIANYLSEAAERDNAKYKTWGVYVWPNPAIYRVPRTYAGIISNMVNWTYGRYNWIDNQFTATPTISRASGRITAATTVQLAGSTNRVWYTLNGQDPRLPGGATNPAAILHDGSIITVSANAKLFARATSTRGWSGPASASYYMTIPPIIVSEIMYHAAPAAAGSGYAAEDFSYVELRNAGTTSLDLTGFKISGTIDYTFTAASAVKVLPAGGRVLLAKNQAALLARYPGLQNIAGEYTSNLGNQSGRLVVEGPLGEPVTDLTYQANWYPATDGNGFSLVSSSDGTVPANPNTSGAWRASSRINGSPGADDALPEAFPPILVNEVVANPAANNLDAIELYNPTDSAVNVGGWFLTDDLRTPNKWAIPAGTMIPAKGYLVFDEKNFNPGGIGFAFDAEGDEVYLFSGTGTSINGYAHGFHFEPTAQGTSLGRYLTSEGLEEFARQRQITLGSVNAGPAVGPVVISEIMFQPPDVGSTNNVADEFIEIHNISSEPAALFDTKVPANTWRLSGGADFNFPANTVLPPQGFALIVNFDPVTRPIDLAAFRAKYGIDPAVPVFGPYAGNLNNAGETLTLAAPGTPAPVTGIFSYIAMDAVDYSPIAQSATDASAKGASIQRRSETGYGNDMGNWMAAAPSAGRGSALRIGSIRASSGNIKLLFKAEANRAYSIHYRDTIAKSSWTKLQDVPAGAAREVEITDALNKPSRFFQISSP